MTLWPAAAYSRTAPGVRPTRYSCTLISLGTPTRFGLSTTVLVRVTLESQNEDALKSFEAAVIECPSVVRCFLMSGSDDYIVIVMARDIEDFERIHRTELSRLPRVARIQSSFAMRHVVNPAAPPIVFGKMSRRGKT